VATTVAPPPPDQDTLEAFHRIWTVPGGLIGMLRTVDNIPIAQRYMATGFVFFLLGGLLGLLMRVQLGTPENTFLDAETYNQIFTMHGTTMMFLFVIPFIEAIANYLLPLLLGTRDLPFPRLTALSYWTYLFGGIFLYSSFIFGVAPDGGWFAYVPLNNIEYSPAINMDFWDIGLSVAEIAAMGAAAEMIVAILRMRATGMALHRVPLFAWAMLVTGVMIIFAFTPLIVGTAMLEFDRKGLTAFFKPEAGGEPLLWQHLFWVFGHPEVYIMFIPAAGIVSHVVQTFSRRPIVGYNLMVLSIIATGFISFGLWVHHMFTVGLSPVAMGFFAAASIMIAIPNGVQIFGWLTTMWTGRPVWRTPLLFIIGFVIIFVIGGLTGVMVAAVPFDWQVHDTYFVVAHFHYVLIGGVIFPLVAGLYYWLPKMTGRLMNERLGRWNFWLMFVFFNVAFFPMHISGLLGMARRVYTYPEGLGLETANLVSSVGAFGFAVGVLLLLVNFFWSLKRGEKAGPNPWDSDSLEWSESSPPPDGQFVRLPVVRSRHPMWEQGTLRPDDERTARLLADLDARPTRWRGGLVVTVLEARPLAIVHMPRMSFAPVIIAVGFVFLFAGILTDETVPTAIGALLTFAGLVHWFWPQDTERKALEELSTEPREDRLPLAIAGPVSNGWWGTWVLLAILVTALVTAVASYYYLADGGGPWPPRAPRGAAYAAVAMVLGLGGGAFATQFARAVRRRRWGLLSVAIVTALLLSVASIWLWLRAARVDVSDAGRSAYASIFAGLIAFQALVLLLVAVMTAVALVWAIGKRGDPRGHAVALNSSLVVGFAAASGVVTYAVLYLSSRVL
jgi:cytochrome c oxidase subunit I+III